MIVSVYVTHKDGKEAKIEGDPSVVRQIEIMLQRCGARWHPGVKTWDFGFYSTKDGEANPLIDPDTREKITTTQARNLR